MQTIKDESFGIVPILKINNEWQVLLIKQISYRGQNDTFWTFPKGHREGNETKEETARRELLEETGISDVVIEERKEFVMNYNFQHKEQLIDKTVTFFIGYCDNSYVTIAQPNEIAALKWCTFPEAQVLLAHKNAQIILNEIEVFLKQHVV